MQSSSMLGKQYVRSGYFLATFDHRLKMNLKKYCWLETNIRTGVFEDNKGSTCSFNYVFFYIPNIFVLGPQYYFKVSSEGLAICGSSGFSCFYIPSKVFDFFLNTFTTVIHITYFHTVIIVTSASTIFTVTFVSTITFTWKSLLSKGIPSYTTVTFETKLVSNCQLILYYSWKNL